MSKKPGKASPFLTEMSLPRGYNCRPAVSWPILHLPRQYPIHVGNPAKISYLRKKEELPRPLVDTSSPHCNDIARLQGAINSLLPFKHVVANGTYFIDEGDQNDSQEPVLPLSTIPKL